MIWVTWRQQRVQILATLGIVVVLAAVLVYVRADVVSLLPDKGLVSQKYNQLLQYYVLIMLVLPVLLGMFAGAPLFAREIEQGTHVFGLTQSISRTRWIATKLLVAGGSLTVLMFLLGLVAAWALAPASFVISGRISLTNFETQGVTVGAYSLVAFTIGAVAGLFLRNTLAAMVTTLVVYTALVIAVANGIRPNYAEPTHFEAAIGQSQAAPLESWLVGYGYLDAKGQRVGLSYVECSRGPATFDECLRAKGVVAQYTDAHLPSQFWRFQFTELAIFLVVAGGVLAAGNWAARRRLT